MESIIFIHFYYLKIIRLLNLTIKCFISLGIFQKSFCIPLLFYMYKKCNE